MRFGWWIAAALAVGCGGDSGMDDTGHDHDGMDMSCTSDPLALDAAVATDGGTWEVSVVAADPFPAEQGFNTWTVAVTMNGASASGLEVEVEPWMPAHDHGTSPAILSATEAAGGQYEVTPFDLFMPGDWEVRVHVADTVSAETATLTLCIPE